MAKEWEEGPVGGRDLRVGWERPARMTVSMKRIDTLPLVPGMANSCRGNKDVIKIKFPFCDIYIYIYK